MGGSYGGYATLVGLTFTPDDVRLRRRHRRPVEPRDAARRPSRPTGSRCATQFYKRMGDPDDARRAGKLLNERSPLHTADKIKRPLLIGQGANDPRVKQAESDQIVEAMKAKDIPVTYVLFPDEGHGFARPENSIAFNAVAENFLARCLGGRAEPVGGTIAASSAKVEEGAALIPGLTSQASR